MLVAVKWVHDFLASAFPSPARKKDHKRDYESFRLPHARYLEASVRNAERARAEEKEISNVN